MKRIIDGVTYNTETATLIAEGSFDNNGDGSTVTDGALYQNRAGVYFHVDTLTTPYRDRHGEVKDRVSYEWFVVGDATKARDWCEKHELTIIRDIEDMPPEATPGEKMATLYIRVPPALKGAIEGKAKDDEVSVNVSAMRCLEQCVSFNRINVARALALAAMDLRTGEWEDNTTVDRKARDTILRAHEHLDNIYLMLGLDRDTDAHVRSRALEDFQMISG